MCVKKFLKETGKNYPRPVKQAVQVQKLERHQGKIP